MLPFFILDFLLVAVPIVLCLIKRRQNQFVLSIVLLLAGILYCMPYLHFGFRDLLLLFLAIGVRVILYPLHWIAWIRATIKKSDHRIHAFPLLTVWLFLLTQGLTLVCMHVLITAIVYAIAAILYSLVCIRLYKPEKKQENGDNLYPA